MNKKIKTTHLIIIVVVFLLVVSGFAYFSINPIVLSFSMDNYNVEEFRQVRREDLLELAGSEQDVFERYEQITTGREAVNAAKNIWKVFYENIWIYQPRCVYYDENNHVWLITSGIFKEGPNLLISETGEVLDMWRER